MPPLTFVHCEPGPVTVTSPLPSPPMTPPAEVKSVPPFWMVRLPTPKNWPKLRVCATAPGAPTTVAFGLVVLMVAAVPSVGTPALQFVAVNQSLDVVPVQLVWARVATVDAESNAIAFALAAASLLLLEDWSQSVSAGPAPIF